MLFQYFYFDSHRKAYSFMKVFIIVLRETFLESFDENDKGVNSTGSPQLQFASQRICITPHTHTTASVTEVSLLPVIVYVTPCHRNNNDEKIICIPLLGRRMHRRRLSCRT